jgi:photosystem II stability/assembly factor-like uncharacterized protein
MKRIAITVGVFLVLSTTSYIVYRLFFAPPYIAEITDSFEKANNVFRIRVNQHPERGPSFLPGAYYVFQSADVASDNWQEVMIFRHDDPVEIPRNQVRFVNEQIGYVFMGWMYAVTTDGGRTWAVWNAEQALPRWICCPYGLIKDVELSADGAGRMKLDTMPGRQEVPELYTQDYGRHWSVTNKAAQQMHQPERGEQVSYGSINVTRRARLCKALGVLRMCGWLLRENSWHYTVSQVIT